MNIYFSTYRQKIRAWIYGHTHTSDVREIDGVKFYCNPVGYKGENHAVNYGATLTC